MPIGNGNPQAPDTAHPVPRDNHDRTLVVRLTPDAVVVDYRLEVDEFRASRDLPGEELEYILLGKTVGFGSYHFSRDTMATLELVLARQGQGRPVNSIFGEGVNPKLRKVRTALDVLGLPSDTLLRHGSPRLVYAVPIAQNFRDVLLGFVRRPHLIVPATPATTSAMVDYWRTRWLAKRIERAEVLDDVRRNSLAYPVTHGARVLLPAPKNDYGPLFATTRGEQQPVGAVG